MALSDPGLRPCMRTRVDERARVFGEDSCSFAAAVLPSAALCNSLGAARNPELKCTTSRCWRDHTRSKRIRQLAGGRKRRILRSKTQPTFALNILYETPIHLMINSLSQKQKKKTYQITNLPRSAHDLARNPQLQRLPRLQPLVLPIRRLHHGHLPHPKRLHLPTPPPRANHHNPPHIQHNPPTRPADQLHGTQHGLVVAVFEFCPYPTLRLLCGVEIGWRGSGDGAARDGGDEPGAEEDGEDSECLGVVVDRDLLVSRAECVLDFGAKVVG